MKFITGFLILSIVFLSACKQEPEMFVTERIQYDVPIFSNDPVYNWWVNNIEGSDREELVNWILDGAYSGKFQAYDYFNVPYSKEEIKNVGIDTIYMSLVREYPPYDEYDTMVVEKYDHRDITKIRFLEEWYMEDNMLQKNIVGMAPVIVRGYGGEEYNQLLFWIYFDERYPGVLK